MTADGSPRPTPTPTERVVAGALALLGLTIALYAAHAIAVGAVYMKVRGKPGRHLQRAEEPGSFWVAVGLYGALGACLAGLGGALAVRGARVDRS